MAILFGDTWVDTNGVLLPAHVPTGPSPGSSWSRSPLATADIQIQGNGAAGATLLTFDPGVHAVFNQPGSWPADYAIAFDAHFFTSVNHFPAVTARHSATTDVCYGIQYDRATGWDFVIWSGANPGVSSSLTGAVGFSYPYPGDGTIDHMIFEMQGNALRLKQNGTTVLSITDNTIAAAGKPGVFDLTGTLLGAATGLHFEKFVISDFTANTPPMFRGV